MNIPQRKDPFEELFRRRMERTTIIQHQRRSSKQRSDRNIPQRPSDLAMRENSNKKVGVMFGALTCLPTHKTYTCKVEMHILGTKIVMQDEFFEADCNEALCAHMVSFCRPSHASWRNPYPMRMHNPFGHAGRAGREHDDGRLVEWDLLIDEWRASSAC